MRTLTSRITVTAVVVAVMPSIVGGQRGTVQAPPLVDAEHKIMQADAAPSTTFRVVGDQASPGVYVVRNHFNPGQGSRPHYHDQDRYITVLKGTWWVGAGDVYDPEKMTPIKAGGFMFHPAGFHHYDGAKDEDTVVQIVGIGPVKTVQTEAKAR